MITARFTCKHHDEFGFDGWAMKGRSWMEPAMGMGVAHDVLEHMPNDDGSFEHELMALGASIFVRDHGQYHQIIGNINPWWVHLGSEVETQWRVYNVRECRSPGRTVGIPDIEDGLQEALAEARRDFGPSNGYHGEDHREAIRFLRQNKSAIRGWWRKGYRRAQQRFKGHWPYELCGLFRMIEEKANKHLKHADLGMELLVKVDVARYHVVCDSYYPEEEYY